MENALILSSFSVEISMVFSSQRDTARLVGSHQLPITRRLQLRTQFLNFEFEVNALMIKGCNDALLPLKITIDISIENITLSLLLLNYLAFFLSLI